MSRKCRIVTIVEGSSEFFGNNPEEKWSSSARENFAQNLDLLFEDEEPCWVRASIESIPPKLKASEIGKGFFSSREYVDEVITLEFSDENEDIDGFQEEYSDLEENCLYHLVDLDVYIHRDTIYESSGRLQIYYFLRFVDT